MKLAILFAAAAVLLLASCAQEPVIHRYYSYHVVTDAPASSERPAHSARRSPAPPAPVYTLPGTPTRLDENTQ
jgi:hypothetical protein